MSTNFDLDVITHSAASTRRVGERLGHRLRASDVVLLSGDLGTGKTTFAQGIAAGLGVTGPVTSPTFTLINEYAGRDADGASITLAHIDLYRLAGDGDAALLGLDDYIEAANTICVVEWPQVAPAALPASALVVDFVNLDVSKRRLVLRVHGACVTRYAADIAALRLELYGATAR